MTPLSAAVPAVVPAVVYGFEETAEAARRLAAALGVSFREVHLHRFPDGESLVRVDAVTGPGLVYRSLDRPNDKLIELMLAAAVLRDAGAEHLTLLAPYLCYMRQDTAFRPGEAVSQGVVGRFLSGLFERVVTVEPHLHRTQRLAEVFPGAKAVKVSAAALLAERLRQDGAPPDTLLVGPDAEARQWVEAVARPLGLEVLVGEKVRSGDRDVHLVVPDVERARGRPVVLVDDLVSTGGTLVACAKQLTAAGAARIEALAIHMLCSPEEEAQLRAAGVFRLRSTDSVPHPSNAIHLAPLLAAVLQEDMT